MCRCTCIISRVNDKSPANEKYIKRTRLRVLHYIVENIYFSPKYNQECSEWIEIISFLFLEKNVIISMDTIQQKFFFIFLISNAFIYACLYTIIIYTYRVYVCTSNQKKSTVWTNRLYVLLYFIPNTFACKSVFNFVKILSSYIILTLHIDIEYLDTPCFVSFVFLFCSHQLFSDLA